MTVYVLMEGDYHEETPTGIFSDAGKAHEALNAAALAHPFQDPFLTMFEVDGDELVCDLAPSPHVVEQVNQIRVAEREATRARNEAYVAAGGVVYSTSSAVGKASSLTMQVRDNGGITDEAWK